MTELVLTEYQTKTFPKDQIPEAIATIIAQEYSAIISINWDWRKNVWQLSPRGYIGMIPITSDFAIRLEPKTKIKYIWQMLDYVEDLDSLKVFDQHLYDGDRLEDICDYFARLLTKKILHRTKQGLYRAYIPENAHLIAPRGRIQWQKAARKPWETSLLCCYNTQTIDVPENQILLWTIHQMGRTHYLFKPDTTQQLRTVHRALQNSISLVPFGAEDCHNFNYHRLNQDYEILHKLCYFFLEKLSPNHQQSNLQSIPFILNTAVLYEKFVYCWLKEHLPSQYEIKDQEGYRFAKKINYKIDLVLYERETKQAIAVLDTKYKTPDKPSNNDISQIITYAHIKNTPRAILIYPEQLKYPLQQTLKNIQIETLNFPLDRSLESAGNLFLAKLINLSAHNNATL
jgi:5-methylcytosine-specific restriction enzyme subunit McrC